MKPVSQASRENGHAPKRAAATDTYDEHGVPRCRHCGGMARVVRFAHEPPPRRWSRCAWPSLAERPKRIGIGGRNLRSQAALLIDWLPLCLPNGWPGEQKRPAAVRTVDATRMVKAIHGRRIRIQQNARRTALARAGAPPQTRTSRPSRGARPPSLA